MAGRQKSVMRERGPQSAVVRSLGGSADLDGGVLPGVVEHDALGVDLHGRVAAIVLQQIPVPAHRRQPGRQTHGGLGGRRKVQSLELIQTYATFVTMLVMRYCAHRFQSIIQVQ